MKAVVVLLSLAAFVSAKSLYDEIPEYNTAYGYLTKFGIPEAERIKKAEEEYLQNSGSRIIGGTPAQLGQFPYQAGLLTNIIGIDDGRRGVCGGVLVSARSVLTAAHCWYDGQNQAWRVEVVLGSTLLFTGGTRLESSNVAVHPLWLPFLILNDVAVIRLNSPVALSDTINTVALPIGSLSNENFAGEVATASGFGITSDGGSIATNQFLSSARMNVITNERCSLLFPLVLQSSNICVSSLAGTSTCRGDSGGPLVVERNGQRVLIGITSFGSALGCEIGFPAVFARVTSFLTFILLNL